jgi:hypothetical protein
MQSPYGIKDTEELVIRRIVRRLDRYVQETKGEMNASFDRSPSFSQFEGDNSGATAVSKMPHRPAPSVLPTEKKEAHHFAVPPPPLSKEPSGRLSQANRIPPRETQTESSEPAIDPTNESLRDEPRGGMTSPKDSKEESYQQVDNPPLELELTPNESDDLEQPTVKSGPKNDTVATPAAIKKPASRSEASSSPRKKESAPSLPPPTPPSRPQKTEPKPLLPQKPQGTPGGLPGGAQNHDTGSNKPKPKQQARPAPQGTGQSPIQGKDPRRIESYRSEAPVVSQGFHSDDTTSESDIPMSQLGLDDFKPKQRSLLGIRSSFIVVLIMITIFFMLYKYLNRYGLVE